ncbi:ribose-5-phosphate isomerase RpiA [Methylomarinum sp. Ch1-1]|uniref:Ribose-5-phosphate isomerase A n=1 Tax=Methylomarinum roseum TaxID=3067653 RepID=A0AAU7NZ27_9GAMM|nr:ribose-5-phosphate isomerase RpiA [Methylomarinum sp. Ch1-1]MDP4521585.1 ribose-5-phosphate isomerase RpiA [Methylomarinum sp. Ch1-1]
MNAKQRVAERAATFVSEGMVVGLGTGSTADYFIQALAELHREGMPFTTVSSSVVSQIKAHDLGLPSISLDQVTTVDLYVDGADEVSPDITLLKGQGADLVREKLLAKASRHFLVLVDESKLVRSIGQNFAIPIEVMPFAWRMVKTQLEVLGGQGDLRRIAGKDNLMISSHGSLILDMVFPDELDVATLNERLNAIPGVVEHGIFKNLANAVFLGVAGGVEERWADNGDEAS